MQAETSQESYSRQVCLDTETTGLRSDKKDRIIEVGAVELIDRRISGNSYHSYFNPEVESIDAGAVAVHGLTAERLVGEPLFRDGVEELLKFVEGAELIIHNAPFDIGFLNAELKRIQALGNKKIEDYCPSIVDSLQVAQSMRPGQGNSLDDLRDFYGITDKRDLHGALVDARILAKVFLRMTGKQESMNLDSASERRSRDVDLSSIGVVRYEASEADNNLHQRLMDKIKAGETIVEQDLQPPK